MPPDPGGTAAEEHDEMIPREGEAGAAAALRHIVRDEQIEAYALRNPPLYDTLLRAARWFIGGETLPKPGGRVDPERPGVRDRHRPHGRKHP